jgi:hypothetical protein
MDQLGPCEGCPGAAQCAAERLACSAFERFYEGRPWEPNQREDATRTRYDSLSSESWCAGKSVRDCAGSLLASTGDVTASEDEPTTLP